MLWHTLHSVPVDSGPSTFTQLQGVVPTLSTLSSLPLARMPSESDHSHGQQSSSVLTSQQRTGLSKQCQPSSKPYQKKVTSTDQQPTKKSPIIYELVAHEAEKLSTSRHPLGNLPQQFVQAVLDSEWPKLIEKYTGADASKLLISWGEDVFMTWEQLPDGRVTKYLVFWWCQRYDYHIYQSTDMKDHLITHPEINTKIFCC